MMVLCGRISSGCAGAATWVPKERRPRLEFKHTAFTRFYYSVPQTLVYAAADDDDHALGRKHTPRQIVSGKW